MERVRRSKVIELGRGRHRFLVVERADPWHATDSLEQARALRRLASDARAHVNVEAADLMRQARRLPAEAAQRLADLPDLGAR